MVSQAQFNGWLLAWVLCVAVILYGQRRDGNGTGLTISYVLQLWLIHWLGAAIYAFPWYKAPGRAMALGLEQSTYAIAGFAAGSLGALVLLRRFLPARDMTTVHRWTLDPWLVRSCLTAGIVTYFVLEPIVSVVPTISALASASANLLLVAIAMGSWNSVVSPLRHGSMWLWVGSAATLPFITIVMKGFLGYGFVSMLTVFAFIATVYRPRWRLVAASVLVGFLALSLYVTYMRDRREIRAVVWGGEAYASRFDAFGRTLTNFELFDVYDYDHLLRIDDRLNQNFFIGRAVEYLEIHPERFAKGRTIWEAALSIIPRSFWPEKPMVAGSGDLVNEFTGITFDKDTSIGIGHILELYANFGVLGVVLGMALLGALVSAVDRIAAARLYVGDGAGFVAYWLPGLSLLQVGGSLVEAVSSAGAGIAIGLVVYWYARSRQRRHQVVESPRGAILQPAAPHQP